MTKSTTRVKTLYRTGACVLFTTSLTGCSVFQDSHVLEHELEVSPYAVASAEGDFVSAPFSLVAADSVGLATFGLEIAQWGTPQGDLRLAEQH